MCHERLHFPRSEASRAARKVTRGHGRDSAHSCHSSIAKKKTSKQRKIRNKKGCVVEEEEENQKKTTKGGKKKSEPQQTRMHPQDRTRAHYSVWCSSQKEKKAPRTSEKKTSKPRVHVEEGS